MPRLFPAEVVIVRKHFLQNISVADVCFYDVYAEFIHTQLQTEIAHNCSYYCIFPEHAALFCVVSADSHDSVAVYYSSEFVRCDESVCVAVEGQTYVRAQLANLCCDLSGIG